MHSDPNLLLLIEEQGRLVVLVDPEWPRKVAPQDHEFISGIIADFASRARTSPGELLAQASELNFGPLITRESGVLGERTADLCDMIDRFVAP